MTIFDYAALQRTLIATSPTPPPVRCGCGAPATSVVGERGLCTVCQQVALAELRRAAQERVLEHGRNTQ